MTDPIREAFEKAAKIAWGEPSIERDGSGYMDGYVDSAWWGWEAAWKQSMREALMEAARICEDKGDQFAILFGENAQQRGYDCAKAIIELISAAAEEEGK